jgi:hypothetical protein
MPGGLLSLVCYGNENIQINGNPQTTWFYKTFMRYTHFSQEPIQIPLDGPNLLLMDAPILLKAKIPRQGDLLSDLVFRFQLPDIFSKAYISNDLSGNLILDRKYEFAWVRQIGARLIDTVSITIGGQLIQEFTSDWIAARTLLDNDNNSYQKWRSMVGDTPEYFDPANGIYSDPQVGGYPNVVAWRGAPQQNNSPSIPGRIIRVPLGLWFSDYIANSLPLIALQYHDCEVTLKLRPIRDLYTVLDPSGVRLRSNVASRPYIPTDQYPNVWNPALLGPLPNTLNNLYGANPDISGSMRYFLTDISGSVPVFDGWPLNATLEATYTFVREEEQQAFVKKTIRYNVRQVQNFIFSGINTRDTYRLDVHNIATRIVYFGRRSDAVPYRNQATNLTNWINTQGVNRPFAVPIAPNVYPKNVYIDGQLTPIGRSGLNIPGLQRRILRNAFLTANGTQLFDAEDPSYFTDYVPYRFLNGNSAPFNDYGLASQSEMWPIHTYSFALHGSSVEQPDGTLNTSRIDRLEMDVDVEPIPFLANYTYELQVFVETLNFLEISSGLGGLKFAK